MKKYLFPLVAVLLFGFFGMILFRGSSSIIWSVLIIVLAVAFFVWVIPIILKQVNAVVWIVTGLIILFGLLFPTSLLMSSNYQFGPFSTLVSTAIFLLPSLALINAVFLLYSGLNKTPSDISTYKLKISLFAMSLLLVLKTLHNLYELTLWDNTYDSLTYIWLIFPIFTVLLSGLALSIALQGWAKLTGTVYSVLLPILLITVSALAQNVDFHQETAKRAERVARAVESYHAREGSYPNMMSQLSPWYVISLPKPMVIYGQDWCYESGDDYYRLGYIDREHWSDPRLIGQIYRSVGEAPADVNICKEEFAAIQNSQPDYPYSYSMESE